VNTVDGDAGGFFLATSVEGHAAETLVQVTVSTDHPSQLALHFSDHHRVLTDACVLLCGLTGALKLLELGYTGPLAIRPRLAARSGPKPPDDADAARSTTAPMRRE
jgi:hypothetical protein